MFFFAYRRFYLLRSLVNIRKRRVQHQLLLDLGDDEKMVVFRVAMVDVRDSYTRHDPPNIILRVLLLGAHAAPGRQLVDETKGANHFFWRQPLFSGVPKGG